MKNSLQQFSKSAAGSATLSNVNFINSIVALNGSIEAQGILAAIKQGSVEGDKVNLLEDKETTKPN